jgi:hypothetical protein
MLSTGRSSTWNATLGQFFIRLSYTTLGIGSSPSKFQLLLGKQWSWQGEQTYLIESSCLSFEIRSARSGQSKGVSFMVISRVYKSTCALI